MILDDVDIILTNKNVYACLSCCPLVTFLKEKCYYTYPPFRIACSTKFP